MKAGLSVVVTGGAGFIGSHVVDRLVTSGADVTVLDDLSSGSEANLPNRVRFVKADVSTAEAVAHIVSVRPNAIVHCAARTSVPGSFEDPARDARANIIGSLRVIEACRLASVHDLVYVSTGGALYGRPMAAPWDEGAPISPISPYGISKSTVESYLRVLSTPPVVTVLRLANVYGPRQGATGEAGVVSIFIRQMLSAQTIVIDGDGEQTRDLLYVGDAVDAIQAAMEAGVGGTFHIGTGQGTSVNALFGALTALIPYDKAPEFGPPRLGDVRDSVLDPTLARRSLSWQAQTSLRAGLAETVGASTS